jgi:hypothetical protein
MAVVASARALGLMEEGQEVNRRKKGILSGFLRDCEGFNGVD